MIKHLEWGSTFFSFLISSIFLPFIASSGNEFRVSPILFRSLQRICPGHWVNVGSVYSSQWTVALLYMPVLSLGVYCQKCYITCKGLQLSLTYLPAEQCSSHSKVPPEKNFVRVRRINLTKKNMDNNQKLLLLNARKMFPIIYIYITHFSGRGPNIFSIMAKCSLLSWVWKRVNPR